jgi:hypothetical protein
MRKSKQGSSYCKLAIEDSLCHFTGGPLAIVYISNFATSSTSRLERSGSDGSSGDLHIHRYPDIKEKEHDEGYSPSAYL